MASKTPKTVASESSKKLTKKEVVQTYENIRDRFKRELKQTNAKIESGTLSKSGMRSAMQFRDSLQESINDTYMIKSGERRGEYPTSIDRLKRRADFGKEMLEIGFDSSELRKRKMFERDVNQASMGGVSTKSKEEVKMFYAATKDIWGGYDITERHKQLMLHFGVNDLQEVWDIVFGDKIVQEYLEKVKNGDYEDGSTDEKDEIDSPEYIKEMIVALDTARKDFQRKMNDNAQ